MQFKKYILLYTLIPLLILTIASTYYRFAVIHDYVVSYEGECDPYKSSCFVGCEDEECTQKYFYTKIERHASDLVRLCGDNVVGCEFSDICSEGEFQCKIEYCGDGDCDEVEAEAENLNS